MNAGHWMEWSVTRFPALTVRKIHCTGHYPAHDIIAKDAVYGVRKGQPFIITRMNWLDASRDPGSELHWLIKEEVRLLSAIKLAIRWGKYRFRLQKAPILLDYPKARSIVLQKNLGRYVDDILALALEHAPEHPIIDPAKEFEDWDEDWGPYSPVQLYKAINPKNGPLIRALACWMKSDMLFHYPMFGEEACALAFFALDGLVKLFHRRYQAQHPRATLKDTLENLGQDRYFPKGFISYLGECYDSRTIIVHPVNDISNDWFPGFAVDDLFDATTMIQDLAWMYLTGDKSRWSDGREGDTLKAPTGQTRR